METVATQEEIKTRGFNPVQIITIPDDGILKIGAHSLLFEGPKKSPKRLSLKKVKLNTIQFYETYFDLKDVPFIKETKLFGKTILELSGTVHPFGLPIKRVNGVDTLFGVTNEVIENPGEDQRFLYRGIGLSNNLTELSSLAYTHEIAHTQINHIKGLVESYYDTEVVSIFLELVHALEADSSETLLRQHDAIRLTELGNIINDLSDEKIVKNLNNRDELVEASMYLESTIKAYNLFIKYYYGSLSIKNAILRSIQQLFNEQTSLNPILRDYDVSSDGSRNVLQFTRYIKR